MKGPVLIEEVQEAMGLTPAEAPPVPEDDAPEGRAMRRAAAAMARRPSRLVRWFWRSAVALLMLTLSVLAWSAVEGLFARSAVLGWVGTGIVVIFVGTLLAICVREVLALLRLERMGDIHRDAEAAIATRDVAAARKVVARITALYAGRAETEWGRKRLEERAGDVFDADALFHLTEAELLAPLDAAARAEVEGAARQVAAVTAVVPLAFADVAAALTSNLRMIRHIAEIYGGRAGTLGSWRLTRAVFAHLVATGAVAVGDDLIGSVAGGSVLAKLSRRFGEGIVNGALTARVGVAAIEVCRPLPFDGERRPQVHKLVARALGGVFDRA